MKQMLKISIYSLTLTTLLFSQSLTGNYQVDYINVDWTWVVRPVDASSDLDPSVSEGNPTNATGSAHQNPNCTLNAPALATDFSPRKFPYNSNKVPLTNKPTGK